MNKGIFKKYKNRGWIKVRVYYYLSPRSTFHFVPPFSPCSLWWISMSALHWAFIDMLVARFAVARVGYKSYKYFYLFFVFCFVCLVVGSRNPMRIPDKSTNNTQNEQWIKVFLRSIKIGGGLRWEYIITSHLVPRSTLFHHFPHVPYGGYQCPPCTGRLLIC